MKENKKYRLTDETIVVDDVILHRIEAVKSFGIIKKGTKGGWIEKEKNLSHEGNCWVYDNAKVYDNAVVIGSAIVCCDAVVREYASIQNTVVINDNAEIYGYVYICNQCIISGNAKVHGDVCMFGNVSVHDNAEIYEFARVHENVEIWGNAKVHGNARLYDNVKVNADAEISGDVLIGDNSFITGVAVVKKMNDFLYIRNNFSSGRGITWTKSNDMYQTGCFHGTAEELIAKAENDDERSKRYSSHTCHKADYFRAIVTMVEKFKELKAKEDEYMKNLKNSFK